MTVNLGHGGWCRITDEFDIPGSLYVRLSEIGGNVRVTEFYLDGEGEPVPPAVLRNLPLRQIEERLSHVYRPQGFKVPGPDLSRLAASYDTAFGVGMYAGRHCDNCGGPVLRPRPDGEQGERALTDWVALSWFSQYPDSGIPRAKRHRSKTRAVVPRSPLPRLDPPTSRKLTDEYLLAVKDAYEAAIDNGLPPAKTLAPLAGVDDRTIHRWVLIARKRGLMSKPDRRGRIV